MATAARRCTAQTTGQPIAHDLRSAGGGFAPLIPRQSQLLFVAFARGLLCEETDKAHQRGIGRSAGGAQRDWQALGQERLLITPLARFAQGKPITLAEGVLFTTYATLRSDDRGEKVSRVRQIVDWLGRDFDGVIIFDESHAMQNAGGGKGERGDVAAIEAGGVAAMEVLARDLRALGLHTARSLSYEGVECDRLEHRLSPEQRRIYDAYAGAFAVIHNNLDAAMEAANITGREGTLNRQAKSAARSAFESTKQRFFGHLLTSMKTPTLLRAIEGDLAAGHASVVQIVSTGEALMERRLARRSQPRTGMT